MNVSKPRSLEERQVPAWRPLTVSRVLISGDAEHCCAVTALVFQSIDSGLVRSAQLDEPSQTKSQASVVRGTLQVFHTLPTPCGVLN